MPSVFSRPNKIKGLGYHSVLSLDMGKLVPCYRQEVFPGDEFKVSADTIIRLAPMLAPIYGRIDAWMHFFFVPNRLLWSNFEDFVTNGLENGVTTAVHPYFMGQGAGDSNWEIGSLADYLAVPISSTAIGSNYGGKFNALPFRAYNKIYNDWYRNEFLQDERSLVLTDGRDNSTDRTLATRCWKRDYFTSALPFRQLGTPVALPLGTSAGVKLTTDATALAAGQKYVDGTGAVMSEANFTSNGFGTTATGQVNTDGTLMNLDPNGTLYADLKNATASTVNDLRTAFQLQRIMERKARSGNRYVEYIASAFGVRSPDARLQRAEFLGGGKTTIMISEVLQTSAATATSPQGQMSGHGFGASRTFGFNKAFTEHGWILGIVSVMPTPSYSQGIPRDLIKDTWTDYYQPELARLGEQAVYKEEVCTDATDGADINTRTPWGYQPMYENYRRRTDEVHGDFRPGGSLNYWTLSRNFAAVPGLNGTFVSCDASGIQSNIFAAGAQAIRPIWVEMLFSVSAVRPMPKRGTPGLIDH